MVSKRKSEATSLVVSLAEKVKEMGSGLTFSIVAVVVISACVTTWLVAGKVPLGMILASILMAFAGVITLGMFAFSADERAIKALSFKPNNVVGAISEPAAIAALDGHLAACNEAWKAAGGHERRLPQGEDGRGLFVAITEARAKGMSRARVRLSDHDFEMVVSPIHDDYVLVRAASEGVLGANLMLKANAKAPDEIVTEGYLHEVDPDVVDHADVGGLEDFAETAPFGAALVSGEDVLDGVICESNGAFEQFAAKDCMGLKLSDLLTDVSLEEVRQKLDTGHKTGLDIVFKSVTDRHFSLHIAPVKGGFRLYVFDISAHKALEQAVAQSQKMQAMGQFAGGIAHDFNNLLTGFKLRNDQLLAMHPLGDPSYEDLNGIRQIIARAEDLVRNLLAYARKQTVKRITLNAGEMVSEAEVLLRRLVREDMKLVTEYGRNLPDVHVDKGQMEMVMMNLVVNARDAMKAQGGGKVTIKATGLSQAQAKLKGFADAPEAGAAMIEVTDTGPGIPPDIMAKVFEPFFTTKPQGEGTGLGLSTVFGIINQAGGHIEIESPAGEGATFRIFLPAWIEKDKPADIKPKVEAKPVPKDLSGVGRILFVEDEQIVRGLAAKLLRQRGYEVLEACDGEEALMIIEDEAGKFDLLISDVIMPGLDGPSMLKKARPILGDHVPVMFISGYAESEFSDLLEEEKNVSFLPKPLDIKTLAERVKEQLAA